MGVKHKNDGRCPMHNVTIRRASATDASSVAALIWRSFRPKDLALTIYGCPGISEYFRRTFDSQEYPSRTLSLVAECEGAVAGFLELRSNPSGVFLNYIATDRRFRGRGLGTLLLKRSLEERNAPAGTRLTLDVFGHNAQAKSWYSRLGLELTGSVGFWRARIDPAFRGASHFQILDLPASDAVHDAFGFSNLTLTDSDTTFTIGRLGSRWLRIADPRLLSKPELLCDLITFENKRELLINLPFTEMDAAWPLEPELLLLSDRMQVTLPLIL